MNVVDSFTSSRVRVKIVQLTENVAIPNALEAEQVAKLRQPKFDGCTGN